MRPAEGNTDTHRANWCRNGSDTDNEGSENEEAGAAGNRCVEIKFRILFHLHDCLSRKEDFPLFPSKGVDLGFPIGDHSHGS